jgi:hypothetical protein
MASLRGHINAVGGQAALDSLGQDAGPGAGGPVSYEGGLESDNWKSFDHFTQKYLARYGISANPATPEGKIGALVPNQQVVSSWTPANEELWKIPEREYLAGDFRPSDPTFKNKLEEAKHLPGLEKSEDVDVIMGQPVTHLTPEVVARMDERYGKGQWIVKAYTEEAFAGYGIFFPQRVEQLTQDCRNALWYSGEALARHGFSHLRAPAYGNFGNALAKFAALTLQTDPSRDNWDQPPEIKGPYGEKVLAAAREGGLLLSPEQLSRLSGKQNVGGLEQDVFRDEKTGRYWKMTRDGNYGQNKDLPEYLARHAMMNKLWPQLGYQFHGIAADHQGRPRAVISMNGIDGPEPSQEEVHDWFMQRGFEPHGERAYDDSEKDLGQWTWRDPSTGTVIDDAHAKNFRKTSQGEIVPIDVDVRPGPGALKELPKQEPMQVVGIQHHGGDEYWFGSTRYDHTIHGDVRHHGDQAAAVAHNETGAALPGGGFMAQPAFKAVGVSDADRAAGKTIAPGEARVHIVTRNGKAEIIPHSTWIKGEGLPVVFESDETKAIAQAAVDAINALPESERSGQVYAPDVLKTENGYKIVEANPSAVGGGSGYLEDNPFIIDAYVSHLTGREPAHVGFIRKLLATRKRDPRPRERE